MLENDTKSESAIILTSDSPQQQLKPQEDEEVINETAVIQKITWKLIPLLSVLYFLSFLDRVNVANAHDELLKDLKLDEKDYALAVGVFFVGYFSFLKFFFLTQMLRYISFEIPSNILLVKTSPRRWIARIMVTWGVISMLQVCSSIFPCRLQSSPVIMIVPRKFKLL